VSVISEAIGSTDVQAAESEAAAFDVARLERAVSALIDGADRLRQENRQLREQLAARTQRIQALESDLRHANQRRQDVAKRIDELIVQIDQLDAQLGTGEEA
jgi:chromosome segregation ATPase